jgi:hypothetical protein
MVRWSATCPRARASRVDIDTNESYSVSSLAGQLMGLPLKSAKWRTGTPRCGEQSVSALPGAQPAASIAYCGRGPNFPLFANE